MEFPSPNIFPHLSDFRQKRLYCDVRLKFHQSPLRPKIFAHRLVLASFSSFFADLCQDDISTRKVVKEISLPPSIDDETINFVIRWMYNEAPKIELMIDEDDEGWRFLDNLRLAAIMLGIPDLQQFLEYLIPSDEGGEDFKVEDQSAIIKEEGDRDPELAEPSSLLDLALQNQSLTSLPLSEDDSGIEGLPTYVEQKEEEQEKVADENNEVVEGLPRKKRKKRKNVPAMKKKVHNAKKKKSDVKPTTVERSEFVAEGNGVSNSTIENESLETSSKSKPRIIGLKHPQHASNDPVLSLHITGNTFSCPQCQFTQTGNGRADLTFFGLCAKHLHREHGVIAPNNCFSCSFEACNAVLYNRYSARNHRERVHEAPAPYQECSVCGLKLKNVKAHMIMQHGGERVPCQVCGKLYSSAERAKLHARIHDKKTEHACKIGDCDFKTTNRGMLLQHSYRRHGILTNPLTTIHQCTVCDYKNPTFREIRRHYNDVHLPDADIKCPKEDCEKRFKNQRLTDNHFKRVHLSKDTKPCSECQLGTEVLILEDSSKLLKYVKMW